MIAKILPCRFYDRPVLEVARALLGMRLVRNLDGKRISGLIIETEAYDGENDLACHAHSGKTKRNAVMYGPPGHAYVYFTYGIHWCLNCVTGCEGYPSAVLIRAIQPVEGMGEIARRRTPNLERNWCNGPAKLTQALAIDGQLNGMDLCNSMSPLFIEKARPLPQEFIRADARVGVGYAPEPWRSLPWRFIAALPSGWVG